MRILGCFKVVSDYDLVADEDWIPDEQLHIDTGYVKLLWNCYDEGALEMMLKLSDLSEGFGVVYELNALTVGKKKHENFLKILYALDSNMQPGLNRKKTRCLCRKKSRE